MVTVLQFSVVDSNARMWQIISLLILILLDKKRVSSSCLTHFIPQFPLLGHQIFSEKLKTRAKTGEYFGLFFGKGLEYQNCFIFWASLKLFYCMFSNYQ